MDKEYVYEDESQEEGLTFKKVGSFLQKAWLRALIYLVVAALLATVIAVPIKVYLKSEPIARTSIEYIYTGIEKGMDPNGAPLDTDNIISTTVLSKAVERANLGKKVKDISTLRSSMRVEAVLTDEYVRLTEAAANGDQSAANTLRNYKMYPTRFNVIISDPSELDLSDDQAKLLLNKIVTCYYEDFQSRYSVTKMFAENTYALSQNENLEFADIYDIYLQSLESVKTFLQDMSESAPTFVSTKNNTTFTQLLSDVNILGNNYSQFNAYILSNNIWRNVTAAKNALEANEVEINNKLEPLQAYIKSLNDQIATIQPTTTSTDAGGVHTDKTEYPEIYDILHTRLDEANRQVEKYNIQLNNIKTRLDNLKTTTDNTGETLKAQAVASLRSLEERTTALITKVNATVVDYYDTTFVSASVRQVQPPVVTRRSIDFNLLVVYAVALIVALLAACVVTGVKIIKSKNAKAKTEVAQSEKTVAAEAEKTETAKSEKTDN